MPRVVETTNATKPDVLPLVNNTLPVEKTIIFQGMSSKGTRCKPRRTRQLSSTEESDSEETTGRIVVGKLDGKPTNAKVNVQETFYVNSIKCFPGILLELSIWNLIGNLNAGSAKYMNRLFSASLFEKKCLTEFCKMFDNILKFKNVNTIFDTQ